MEFRERSLRPFTNKMKAAPTPYLQYIMLVLSALGIFTMFYLADFSQEFPQTDDSSSSSPEQTFPPPQINASFSAQATTSVNAIVADAVTFYNSLTSAQQSSLQLTYTTSLARKWSNLPCGTTCRNGLQLGTNLTSTQYAAAMQIVKDALSSISNEGYDEFHQMNLAEAYLHANGGGSGYDSTLRWMAFLNTPTATGAWMLQFGGHHYAANIAFNNGHVIGATPFFMGLEPKTFTYNAVSYDPLGQERTAFANAFASLSSAQLSTAYLSSSFSDCVMIPGETNGGTSTFPAVNVGQALSSLTSTQQNLVLEVIKLYVEDMDADTYNAVIAGYTSELSQTYISYHDNGTSGNPSSFLTDQGDYVRISGPHVWIEFSCQGGIVIMGQIHYHTVWRDRSHDYGVDLTGAAIDVSSTLPVSLLEFRALQSDFANTLAWTTGAEVTSSNFEILRSADGSNFSSIAKIESRAAGGTSSTPLKYTFEDTHPLDGNNYYKLAQVDKDGKTTYSSILLLKRQNAGKMQLTSVYPNPAKQHLTVGLASASSQRVRVAVTNAEGRIVRQQSLKASAGNNTITLDLTSASVGTYWLRVFGEDGVEATSKQILKQ